MRLGDPISALGYPNIQVQGKELKLTRGEINSLAGVKDDERYFQISAPVQPGNSGGPLLDRFGNVIGVVTLRLDDLRVLCATGAVPQNVNYALKSAVLFEFIQSVPVLKPQLRGPRPATDGDLGSVIGASQEAVVLVQCY